MRKEIQPKAKRVKRWKREARVGEGKRQQNEKLAGEREAKRMRTSSWRQPLITEMRKTGDNQEKKRQKNIQKVPENTKSKVKSVLELFKQKEEETQKLKRLSVENRPKYVQIGPESEEITKKVKEDIRKSDKKPKNCLSTPKIPQDITTIKSKSKNAKSAPRKNISSRKCPLTNPKNCQTFSKGKKSSSCTPRKKIQDIRNYFENFQAKTLKKEEVTDKFTFGAACQINNTWEPYKQDTNCATSRLEGIKPTVISPAYTALSHSSTSTHARPQTGLKQSKTSTCQNMEEKEQDHHRLRV